jgi:hypothetical protein
MAEPQNGRVDLPAPVMPDYQGACISNVVGALSDPDHSAPEWVPPNAREADHIVLLVLDGLG